MVARYSAQNRVSSFFTQGQGFHNYHVGFQPGRGDFFYSQRPLQTKGFHLFFSGVSDITTSWGSPSEGLMSLFCKNREKPFNKYQRLHSGLHDCLSDRLPPAPGFTWEGAVGEGGETILVGMYCM